MKTIKPATTSLSKNSLKLDSTRHRIIIYFIYLFILCTMNALCTEEEFCDLWERIDNLNRKKVIKKNYYYYL